MFDRAILERAFLLLCVAVVGLTSAMAQKPDATNEASAVSKKAETNWQENGWPLLEKFCLDCHNADNQEAEVDLSLLEHLDPSDPASSSMQRVLEMVRFGAMPPDDADLPNDAERKKLVNALDQALYSVVCDLRPRPGQVTARRLNRAEYNNTIRDLFGMDLRPADQFPSDEVGAGFDNNGDVLSLSPMQIEKYLSAAESVSQQAIIDPDTLPRIDLHVAADQLLVHGDTKTGRFNGRFLKPDAFAWFNVTVPIDGDYEIEISGGNSNDGNPKTDVAVFDQTGLLVQLEDMRYYGGSGRSRRFDFEVKLTKGDHRFFLEPIEDDVEWEVGKYRSERFAKFDQKVIREIEKRANKKLKPDDDLRGSQYPFMFRGASVEGPRRVPTHLLPASQRKLLLRTASRSGDRWSKVDEAAIKNLMEFGRRAFRQPVTRDEIQPYADLVVQACDRGESFYRGMQIAVSAVLVSPRFLFRVETPKDGHNPKVDDGPIELDPYQIATRLSYFLWSSTPDDHLLNEAKNKRLSGKSLENNVRRMLADSKSDSLATQFASQWLGLRNLSEHEADTEVAFKGFDPKLMKAMSRETELLFLHMVRTNRPVGELLTADYTFLNRDLAKHYDIEHDSTDFQRVSLLGTPRRGLLSHASMLTLTSNPTRTSPVKRGKWILENVLGTPPPDPPADVPDLDETKTADESASLRKQLEIHRDSPTCASCHRVMDQLGFGLEQFDAIGRYRTMDGKLPVDASGVLPGGRKFNGATELSAVLGETEREAFAKTAVERLLTFAIGRELRPADRCVVEDIVQQTKKNDYRLVDVIIAVVQSQPFRYYDAPIIEK